MKKKSQVGIVTIILIVLISVILVVILWNLIMPLINEKADEQNTQGLFITLKIDEVILFPTGSLKVTLSRVGSGELHGLTFVFEGNSSSVSKEISDDLIVEGESRTYSFSPIAGMTDVSNVKIIPILSRGTGSQIESEKIAFKVPDGLVSWWRFEGDVTDFLGVNNCRLVSGTIGNSLIGQINCGNDSSLSTNLGMISFWVKTDKNGEIFSKGKNYQVLFEDSIIKLISTGENLTGDDRTNLTDNNWHHIGIGSVGVWVDGVVQNSDKIVLTDSLGEEDLMVGNINLEIDEVMFFNKSLAGSQIQGIYNLQKDKFVELG